MLGLDQSKLKPLQDRVLVRRLPLPQGIIIAPDGAGAANGSTLREGIILAVGPGKYDEDGDFQPTTVKPGQRVMFNARWNDFAHGELRGTDCDGEGPLERPLPLGADASIHLIQEADIAGILS